MRHEPRPREARRVLMSSTVCSCVGSLAEQDGYDIVVIDPTCLMHGDHAHAWPGATQS